MNFFPLMMTVWPALCPSAETATTEKFSERTSTILPLPSSPHCAPTMTAVLPFFKVSSVVQDGGRPGRICRVAHTPRPRELRHIELQGFTGLMCTDNHNLPGGG